MRSLFKMFSLPQPVNVAKQELQKAQLDLLGAHGAQEAAAGHVTILKARVARLQATVTGYAAN